MVGSCDDTESRLPHGRLKLMIDAPALLLASRIAWRNVQVVELVAQFTAGAVAWEASVVEVTVKLFRSSTADSYAPRSIALPLTRLPPSRSCAGRPSGLKAEDPPVLT